MCHDAQKGDRMERGAIFTQSTGREGFDPLVKGNPKMWVQMGEESYNTN